MKILLFLKLCFSIVQKREISDAIDEPILEWTPILMSTNYEVQDQLTLWLITLINATSHLVHGNQLKLNIRDVLLFASDYSITGLAREEEAFKATDDKNRTKHYSQHQVMIL